MQLSYGSKQSKQHKVNSRQQKSLRPTKLKLLLEAHRPAVCCSLSAVYFMSDT
jgi:hypothetical protein